MNKQMQDLFPFSKSMRLSSLEQPRHCAAYSRKAKIKEQLLPSGTYFVLTGSTSQVRMLESRHLRLDLPTIIPLCLLSQNVSQNSPTFSLHLGPFLRTHCKKVKDQQIALGKAWPLLTHAVICSTAQVSTFPA